RTKSAISSNHGQLSVRGPLTIVADGHDHVHPRRDDLAIQPACIPPGAAAARLHPRHYGSREREHTELRRLDEALDEYRHVLDFAYAQGIRIDLEVPGLRRGRNRVTIIAEEALVGRDVDAPRDGVDSQGDNRIREKW